MNRLDAARWLYNDWTAIPLAVGSDMFLFHTTSTIECDNVDVAPGLYSYRGPRAGRSDPSNWKRETWKSVLQLIRAGYNRREDEQCKFRYESGALCTDTGSHVHCRCCQETTQIDWSLCQTCSDEAEKERYKITKLMGEYYQRFGVSFQKDEELYSHMLSDGDDGGRCVDSGREDFHSDG